MPHSPVLLERNGHVAHIRFARPDVLNALNAETAEALLEACLQVMKDPDVRVVLLSGEGRAFMAGGDLHQLRKHGLDAAKRIISPFHQSIHLLDAMPVPVVASVHGAVAGAGLSLMMVADLAIAAEGTRFNFAYSDIATSCDGGASWALPRLVGLRKSVEIAMLGEPFDAQQALQLGLITRVVPASQLTQATWCMADRLLEHDPFALAQLKHLLRSSLDKPLGRQLEAEREAFIECVARPNFPAAIDAFFEAKRSRRNEG